jgi:ATP phosphoribosyltransferase regulatory subunit
MMGLRADSTPQVARIDAHLLNRRASPACATAARCCTPCPTGPHATREPLQFGAEIYGHAGLEADLEILLLALDCLKAANLQKRPVSTWPTPHRASLLAGGACRAAQMAHLCMRRWRPRTASELGC